MTYTADELMRGEASLSEDCELCGYTCCTNQVLIIPEAEWNRIAEALDRSPKGLALSTRAVPIPTENPEEYRMLVYPCPFLDTDGGCIIHSVRPTVCRDWPYLKAVKQLEKGETPKLHSKCPAIRKWKKRIEEQRK